jgi:WD repeat-containing protein 45
VSTHILSLYRVQYLILYLYRNRQSTLSPLTPFLPLPKYFDSEWSYAQYRIPAQSSHISISTPSPRSPTDDVPDEERCMVGWIETPVPDAEGRGPATEHQLIALTYTGGWYRLALPSSATSNTTPTSPRGISGSPPKSISTPRPRTSSSSSMISRLDKGKDKEREKEAKESRECSLQEYRRFGRWDGWG